jgi:hypothetical protein
MVLEFATKISDEEFPCHSFSGLLGMLPSKEDNGKCINIMFQKYIFGFVSRCFISNWCL